MPTSIRIKVSIPSVILAFSLITVLVITYWMLKTQEQLIKAQSDHFLEGISLVLNADRDLYQAREAELNLLAKHGSAEKTNATREKEAQQVTERYGQYKALMQDYPNVLADSVNFYSNFQAWKGLSDQLVTAIQRNDEQEIITLRKELDKKFAIVRQDLNIAGESAEEKVNALRHELIEKIDQIEQISMVIIGLLLLASLWLTYSIPRKIDDDLQQAISTANAIANGDLNTPIEVNRTDEIGQLLTSIKRVQDTLQLLTKEMKHMAQMHDAGDIDIIINKAKFQNDFQQIANNVNDMVAAHINVKKKAMAVFKSFGDGDFNANIEKLPGKKAFINDTIESVRHNLKTITSETNSLIKAVSNGQLNQRASTDQLDGDWKAMIVGINQIVDGIVLPVNEAVAVLMEIEQGNLTQTVQGNYKGQLNDFKQTVNNTVIKLSETINQATQTSQTVSHNSQELAQGAADLSQRIQQQAAAVEETSATMNEMASAVETNTQNAQQVAHLAQEVQTKAKSGVAVMRQTINAMQSINDASTKIADIVTLMDSIAFQTNLLALNAAVEAARAGEHGRGFAVVAGEVRTLAQKSADAAKEIKTLIDDSVNRVKNGMQLAEKSGEMLNDIDQSIELVSEMTDNIANASKEQSEGINQVHKAISQIDQVTQQNAALVEETTAAAESMSSETDILQRNMSFFNTGYRYETTQSLQKTAVHALPYA